MPASVTAKNSLTITGITDKEIYHLINACRKGDRGAQDTLYRHFYGYAMGVTLRYSRNREEAMEIVNDGFIKLFSNLKNYKHGNTFKGWLRRIMINASIDYFRRNEKHYHTLDISYAHQEDYAGSILDQMSAKEILKHVQRLPASYRVVFNLFVIEGFKHEEIAAQLNISVGTSKSNLSIARSKLRKMLINDEPDQLTSESNG